MTIHKKITIANSNDAGSMDDGVAPPNHVRPFMLEESQLRGRIVRLPSVINEILQPHAYPAPVARLLAEGLCLVTLLAGMLKFDGIFTLQVKGEGLIRSLVCDMTADGVVRGYAGYEEDAVQALVETNTAIEFTDLVGGLDNQGYVAFTVDQAHTADRYQGIVALSGDSLTESVQAYFRQSEQIRTGFVTQIDQSADGTWTGAALMLQQLPPENVDGEQTATSFDENEESWLRNMMLLNTLKEGELLDNDTPLNTILYRLFHEEGVRVFSPIGISKGCRCSREKIRTVLDNLSEDDKLHYAEDGVIAVTCEFCATTYSFPVSEL